ncbi:MAG TPA: hypothetical protein VHG33_13055 [Woeseiaceae bacterium]|nr:hypothetical protein [Woeseiaceae bacterium]
MKYAIAFFIGLLLGASLFLLALYHNPFAAAPAMSPLSVSDQRLLDFSFSAVPAESIAFTNDGESRVKPHPDQIADLWEPAIRQTNVLVAILTDGRGAPAGVGVKFSSESEETRLLTSEALVNSVWQIYLPESGTLFIDQTENLWGYFRNIVLPARWNSADSWRGAWYGVTTVGPGALGTARVTGGSGRYAGLTSEAVESWRAQAYSALRGPVAMTGHLTIAVSPP